MFQQLASALATGGRGMRMPFVQQAMSSPLPGRIHRQGPWRHVEAVEYTTLAWVDLFNTRRLLEPIGHVPPVEYEAAYYRAQETHVHDTRYTDDDLSRLDTLELLIGPGGMRELRPWYRLELRRIKRKWNSTSRGNNRQLKKLLDAYFGSLHRVVFGPRFKIVEDARQP